MINKYKMVLHSQFNTANISQYRIELMGLAAVGIIACHAVGNHVAMPGWLTQICSFGQLGVSIFFFLSGLGIWYSLQNLKYERNELLSWYKKRYIKLFVPFLILAIPYFAYQTIKGGHNFWYFFTRITTIEFWISGGGAWFVSPLVVLYFIGPGWNRLLQKTGWNAMLSWLLFLIILFGGDKIMNHASEIAFFFLGFWIAPYVKNETNIIWIPLLVCSVALYIVFRLVPVFDVFPRVLFLVPLFIILPCMLFDRPWLKKARKFFQFMGNISLESYLTNVFLPAFFVQAAWIHHYPALCKGNRIGYLLVVVVGIGLAYASHMLSKKILSKIALK